MASENNHLTGLLERWRSGDRSAEQILMAEIYPVLCAQAQAQLSRLGGRDLTLCATELAHEAYERLERQRAIDWQNRNHFYAIAATVIRRVLVDYVRQKNAEKRGSGQGPVSLEDLSQCQIPETSDMVDLLVLDQIMEELGRSEPELLRVVELRIFSGLNVEQIADVCQISTATVGRRWRFARAWLSNHVSRDGVG